jgi:molybdopterin-guanine dinucleotide biosynthesis protein A
MRTSRKSRVESREPATARQSAALDPRLSTLAPTFNAVILAGGKSSRMGRDKAWLEINGQPLLARQIELARTLGAAEVFISGRAATDYSRFGCPVLQDRFPNAGPLAGIESALAATTAPVLLALAVDMPEMVVACLEKIRAACGEHCGVIPQVGGRIEPLAGFYPKAALDLAVELLGRQRAGAETGAPGPTDFARECVNRKLAAFVEVPATEARYFTNLNSPEDWRANRNSVL